MVRLREYDQDPNTPTANDVLPAAFAAVRNSAGELLLVRRIDDGNWELPGGRIEVGESASHTVVREVAEECRPTRRDDIETDAAAWFSVTIQVSRPGVVSRGCR